MTIPARAIEIPTTTTDLAVVGGTCVLYGYSFLETTGSAAAALKLRDGGDTGAALVASVVLAQGTSSTVSIPTPGIELRGGLFLDVTSGSVAGSVWIVPGEHVGTYEVTQGNRAVWSGDE